MKLVGTIFLLAVMFVGLALLILDLLFGVLTNVEFGLAFLVTFCAAGSLLRG